MRLVNAKLRGLGHTPETEWFNLGPRLNLFHCPAERERSGFIAALQTINPPYECSLIDPFADFPKQELWHGHLRAIKPEKRTVALSVFSAEPTLVQELAAHSPLLYETDRIEVGRKLDYSRWINFVELASSTRWSEIAAEIGEIVERQGEVAPGSETIRGLLEELSAADRVKGTILTTLDTWLSALLTRARGAERERTETLLEKVRRDRSFRAARTVVEKRLPFFIVIDGGHAGLFRSGPEKEAQQWLFSQPTMLFLTARLNARLGRATTPSDSEDGDLVAAINEHLERLDFLPGPLEIHREGTRYRLAGGVIDEAAAGTGPLPALHRLRIFCGVAGAIARVLSGTDPILLFNGPEAALPAVDRGRLTAFIRQLASGVQCLYATGDAALFSDDTDAVRHRCRDLARREGAPRVKARPPA